MKKTEYIKDFKGALLVDDYTHNGVKWTEKGGLFVKVMNDYDNELGHHTVKELPYVKSLFEILL